MPRLLDTSLDGFQVPAAVPAAALIIVHGLAEYADRYRAIAAEWAARGISTFAYDQRGHGATPGTRTHVDRFSRFVDDLNELLSAVHAAYPQLSVFIWGHSMGSIVAVLSAATLHPAIHGVITTSNSLEIFRRGTNPLNPFFRVLSRLAPRMRIPLGLDSRKISSDESVQHAYATDSRIPSTASVRLIVEFAAACEAARKVAPGISLPWLNVHGAEDRIAPVAGSNALHELLGSSDKRLQIYPGLRHEVHNEVPAARRAFVQLITQWILDHAGRSPQR
ncbi:lysophospholipase [Povalibacter sp.]|uniref:alpha/beta hydrolase n=1 Tax=Povalibacter sp. TaxID=1962978 RepID=UPI002F3FE017